MERAVYLDVGGKIFKTNVNTLISKSDYFASMFNNNWKEKDMGTIENPIFIDRDPDNFKQILSWMRDPNYIMDGDLNYEFQFYLLKNIQHNDKTDDEDLFDGIFRDNDSTKEDLKDIILTRAIDSINSKGYISHNVMNPNIKDFLTSEVNDSYFDRYLKKFRINCGNSIVQLTPKTENNIHTFDLMNHCYGDVLKHIWILVYRDNSQKDHWTKYNLLDSVDLIVGGNLMMTMTGEDFFIYEQTHKTTEELLFGESIDKVSDYVVFKFPIFNVSTQYSHYCNMDLIVKSEFKCECALESVFLEPYIRKIAMNNNIANVFNVPLNEPESKLFFDNLKRTQDIQTNNIQLAIKYKGRSTTQLNGYDGDDSVWFKPNIEKNSRNMYFKITPHNDIYKTIPFIKLRMIVNGTPIIDMYQRLIVDKMAEKGIYKKNNVYCLSFEPGYINFGRIDNLRIVFTIDRKLYNYPLKIHILNEFHTVYKYQNGMIYELFL